MAFRVPSLPLLAAVTLSLVGPDALVRGNAIASWWVDTEEEYAPNVFKYNETTGGIYASLCNSVSTPIFAENDTTALETEISPIAGSSIASLGYLNGSTIEANVFYLADLDGESTVASASYTCNATTGRWSPSGPSYNAYVSNGTNDDCAGAAGAAPALDPAGGLSALYLGVADGMRVFFKTAEFQTHYLQYQFDSSDDDCPGWSYAGIASNLTTGHEVSSAFLPSKPKVWTIAQTVFVNESATADSSGEVEISTSSAKGVEDLWSINRMPTQIIAELKEDNTTAGILTNMSTTASSAYRFVATDSWGFTFSSFSSAAARLGTATNSGGIPSVFYVGADGYLRRFASDTQGHWHEDDSQDDTKWPAADDPSADFGVAYDAAGNRVWLYYISQGAMVQVYQSAVDVWQNFDTLPTYNTSLAASGSSSSSDSGSSSSGSGSGSSSSSSSSTEGLTAGAKAGLGVGLGVGIPLLCAAAFFFFLRRRRAAADNNNNDQYPLSNTADAAAAAAARTNSSSPSSGLDQNQGYWQNGMWVEKTATAYYAAGGPGAARAEQLGELPVVPIYEAPGHGQGHEAHEMPTEP